MISAITPLPPLKTGIAVYSKKLYAEICKIIDVKLIANRDAEDTNFSCKTIKTWDYLNPLSVIRVLEKLAKEKPKILHLQLAYTWIRDPLTTQILVPLLLLFSRIIGCKNITTLHGVVSEETLVIHNSRKTSSTLLKIIAMLYSLHYRILAKLSDAIIVHNSSVKEKLLEKIGVRHAHKIHIVPHGVDILPKKTNIQTRGKINIVFTGFIRRNKGIEELLKAAYLLDDSVKKRVKIWIIGSPHIGDDPEYYHKIVKMIKQFGLERIVKLDIRFIPERELTEIIRSADVIVLPYKDYFYEASGVLARAIGAGKPVICTRIPKFYSELRENEEALFVSMGNPRELADAITLLITNEKLRKKLERKIISKSLERTWRKVGLTHVKIYLKLLKEKFS
ncbi:MAG: glycosyltransferase [Candidatus Njordarchaeia archaeon]